MAELKLDDDGAEPKSIRTNTDFVKHCENVLGIPLDLESGEPAWKLRQVEAGKLKRKRETNKKLYTMDNLVLTVEYLRRRKQTVKSAAAVCWHVDKALQSAAERDVTPAEFEVNYTRAIEVEQAETFGPDQTWLGRLQRARGDARSEVYAEWRSARGIEE